MNSSRRVFVLIAFVVAVFALWMAYGPGENLQRAEAQEAGAGEQDMQANLDRAAESVIAAAAQGVHAAGSEDQLLERTDLSIEALRILGLLGASDIDAKAAKLLDEVQAKASPAAAEVIVRMRLARQLQQWSKLSAAEREKAINRFVSDVQAEGLTPGHADLLLRLTDNLEMGGQGKLAASAVTALLPAFKSSSEPSVQRRTPLMEGIVRRLDLVGKPFELEGDLLDGSEFDWDSYRGKVVLVDFFANWCGVCREEVPIILQCYQAYHDKGFEVVGVSLDKQAQLAEAYRQETGFEFPVLFSSDPRAMEWNSPLATKYGVTSLPRAILVDQQGNVVDTIARGERLLQNLQKLLGAPAGGLGEASEDSGVVPASFNESADENDAAENSAAPAVPE